MVWRKQLLAGGFFTIFQRVASFCTLLHSLHCSSSSEVAGSDNAKYPNGIGGQWSAGAKRRASCVGTGKNVLENPEITATSSCAPVAGSEPPAANWLAFWYKKRCIQTALIAEKIAKIVQGSYVLLSLFVVKVVLLTNLSLLSILVKCRSLCSWSGRPEDATLLPVRKRQCCSSINTPKGPKYMYFRSM